MRVDNPTEVYKPKPLPYDDKWQTPYQCPKCGRNDLLLAMAVYSCPICGTPKPGVHLLPCTEIKLIGGTLNEK